MPSMEVVMFITVVEWGSAGFMQNMFYAYNRLPFETRIPF